MVFLVAAGLLAGCSAGSSVSTTSLPVTTSSSSAGTSARATATPTATASPGQGLLGVLPVPAGATPSSGNTNALMNRVSFVKAFYPQSEWTSEEALYVRRGFVAGVMQAWDNADGSQQSITLARFATPAGSTSAFDEVVSFGKNWPKPVTTPTDPATGAGGFIDPTLDSSGDAVVEWVAAVGDTMIFVNEWTAAKPDPAAATALLHQQYDRLKNGS